MLADKSEAAASDDPSPAPEALTSKADRKRQKKEKRALLRAAEAVAPVAAGRSGEEGDVGAPNKRKKRRKEAETAMSAAVAMNVGPLVIENQGLRVRVAQLSQTVLANSKNLADERLRYVKEIEKLNRDNARLHKSKRRLKAEIVHLKTIIADQQSKIDAQTVRIDELLKREKVKDAELLKREKVKDAALARLMRRENLITAREAMRALEWFICLETVGLKSRMLNEKLFTISAIEQRPELKLKLPTWVTPEVLVELRKSKSDGNNVIHDATFTRDDVEEAFADADPVSKKLKMTMLKKLDAYYTLHCLTFGAPLKR